MMPDPRRYEVLRSPTDDELYGDDVIRSAGFGDSTIGRILSALLPQNQMTLNAPDASIMDTVEDRLRKLQTANEGASQEASLGLGMGSPGMLPVAAPAVFSGRPWIRELIGELAGPKWLQRWEKNINQPPNIVARDAMKDYLNKVGFDPLQYGLEWEVLSKNPPSWRPQGAFTSSDPYHYWEALLPDTYNLKEEILRPQRPPSPWQHSGEITTRRPLTGWNEIEQWLTKEGDRLIHPRSNVPEILGGKYGGGGHIHMGPGEGKQWDPDLMKDLYVEYLKAEPFILPPVPATKRRPMRSHVPSSVQALRNKFDPLAFRIFQEPEADLQRTMRLLPAKGEGGIAFRAGLDPPRPELRAFYSPEHIGEWGENLLIAQYLLDKARLRFRKNPSNIDELLDEIYNEVITPNKEKIRDIHRNRWYPDVGIHEAGSPYANGLVERVSEFDRQLANQLQSHGTNVDESNIWGSSLSKLYDKIPEDFSDWRLYDQAQNLRSDIHELHGTAFNQATLQSILRRIRALRGEPVPTRQRGTNIPPDALSPEELEYMLSATDEAYSSILK